MPEQFIYTTDDVLRMLDALLADGGGAWWNGFFSDRSKPCPFFVEWPDENLVEWFDKGLLAPGRVLELGCGNGRNAAFLAGKGYSVDAVDFSAEAIEWAMERAKTAGVPVNFQCCSIFDATFTEGSMTWSTTPAASTTFPRTAARTMSNSCAGRSSRAAVTASCVSGQKVEAATRTGRFTSSGVSGAAWATQRIACVPSGMRTLSPCRSFDR
jgi:SAM-dependent methyltransferase